MKKTLLVLAAAALTYSLYAFDTSAHIKPAGAVKDYTRTAYTITEKFGDYYRSPKAKFVHVFDSNELETETSELTPKDSLVDRLVFSYDAQGNLAATTGYDSDGKVSWKSVISYDAKGNKTEESEYNASDMLVNKSIWKITAGKQSEEAYYNADGALLGKTITKFDDQGRDSEICSYNADGSLEQRRAYTYNDAGKLSEIAYSGSNGSTAQRVVFRFDEKYAITEEQTYNSSNKLVQRIIYKYDENGNVARTTTYTVSEKFGGTVNELIDINEYAYNYGEANAQPAVESAAVSSADAK